MNGKHVRRQFKPEFKARIVIDLLTGTTTMAKACQKYHLKHQVVSRWKADFLERAPEVFAGNAQHEADQDWRRAAPKQSDDCDGDAKVAYESLNWNAWWVG